MRVFTGWKYLNVSGQSKAVICSYNHYWINHKHKKKPQQEIILPTEDRDKIFFINLNRNYSSSTASFQLSQ